MAKCGICGCNQFKAGPLGRMSKNGRAPFPRCLQCRSLERHRIIRKIYDAIPDVLISNAHALQFSPDIGAPKERFRSFEVSIYGGENSLDLCAIDRKKESYDWVVANHVIEHVDDDRAAMRELVRILDPEGVLQITVPETFKALETTEYEQPLEEEFFHWRSYGTDFPLRYRSELQDVYGLQAVAIDDVTGCWDVVYLFTQSRKIMRQLGSTLFEAGVIVLRAC